jgi:hypothetical protein
MKFQASGFSVDVPDDVVDASAYVFSFPASGGLPPNVSIRFESGEDLDLESRRQEVLERIRDSYPDPVFKLEDPVRSRGDWQYFTYIVEFGDEGQRLRQKEMHLRILQPRPTLYIFSGTDTDENFERFEPYFDSMVRSFNPNEIQRIN